MKKFFVLPIAVALMGAGFCSCSDDDNEEIVEPAKAYAIEAANDLTWGVIAINPTNAIGRCDRYTDGHSGRWICICGMACCKSRQR